MKAVIYLYDDYALITCNYKDGSIRISFEEIEGSDLLLDGTPKRRVGVISNPPFWCARKLGANRRRQTADKGASCALSARLARRLHTLWYASSRSR